MHHIQRKILNLLMYAPSLTYAQMRPKGVESNHFAYHLEQLVKSGLVSKRDRNYSLTNEGMALADRASHTDMTIRTQPHIVTTAYVTDASGRLLLFKHEYQPYMNLYGFAQGRLHYGESIAEAVQRELFEKTGLESVELTHRGMVYVTAKKAGEDISRILSHVFTGQVADDAALAEPSEKGFPVWEDATKLDKHSYMPGFWEIKKLADESKSLFFAEIESPLS